jgi:predicted phage terminase large subunit-like protein
VYALAWISENPQYPGAFFKRSSIHFYDSIPEDGYKRIFMAWDTALKDGGQGDWTVCTVWLLHDKVYYLLHVERGVYNYSQLQKKFAELSQKYKPMKILIEETVIGKSLKNDRNLQGRSLIKLVPIEPDRTSRVFVLHSMFEQGLVQFPKNASFMKDVETELLSYPHGQTDDIVESITLALTDGGKGYDTSMNWVK